MTREEFSQMLVEAKKDSGIGTAELSFAMKLLLPNLKRIENAAHNYNMGKALDYVDAVNCSILITKGKRPITINAYQDIVAWLAKMREKNSVTQLALATAIGCSRDTIAKTEAQKVTMSIDTFLGIASFFEHTIQIKPNGK